MVHVWFDCGSIDEFHPNSCSTSTTYEQTEALETIGWPARKFEGGYEKVCFAVMQSVKELKRMVD